MAKKGAIIRTTIANGILFVEGWDGETRLGLVRVDPAEFPVGVTEGATLNGFKQGLVDCAALPTGATPNEKWDAVQARYDRWVSTGQWASAGERGEVSDGLLVRAIMEYRSLDKPTAQGLVSKMDGALQYKMRESAALKPIIDRMKAERATKGGTVDADAALNALMAPTKPTAA